MASAISFEYLNSIEGVANGLATLDGSGKLPISQLPENIIETYKGEYLDSIALIAAYPLADLADYAYVIATNSYWYWNDALLLPGWVNQQITAIAYLALTPAAKAAVPYIIIP